MRDQCIQQVRQAKLAQHALGVALSPTLRSARGSGIGWQSQNTSQVRALPLLMLWTALRAFLIVEGLADWATMRAGVKSHVS